MRDLRMIEIVGGQERNGEWIEIVGMRVVVVKVNVVLIGFLGIVANVV